MYFKSAREHRTQFLRPDQVRPKDRTNDRNKVRRPVANMEKIRALIVDDSSVMRKIVERSLRQAGVELDQVCEASNGAEALSALHDNPVDLILCDINMPVMDGLEFVRRVSTVESARGIPIVMITTEGSEAHVVQALSAGARGYIRKPFTPDQVKEHVLPVLGKKP
jgi:two-component system, chemotaxis family, chemotaxis protein CheY